MSPDRRPVCHVGFMRGGDCRDIPEIAQLGSLEHRLAAVHCFQFGGGVVDMKTHRCTAAFEYHGDFDVGFTHGRPAQTFHLAAGQAAVGGYPRTLAGDTGIAADEAPAVKFQLIGVQVKFAG